MGDYGIKVSQKGYDVNKCADYQLIFSSSFLTLKIHKMGTATVSAVHGDVTIAHHGLGYVPAFWVFVAGADGKTQISSPGTSQFFAMDSQDLKYLADGPGITTITYFIFRYDITTNYSSDIVRSSPGLKESVDDYGIKIAREGKSIDSDDYRDYIIHSNCRAPIIHKGGTGHFGVGGGSVDINHDLGYQPMFFMYAKLSPNTYYQMVATADDSFARADLTKVTFIIPYECDYAYLIFKDPIKLD